MEIYRGLTSNEVELSKKEYGTNKITEKKKISLWTKYWSNFNDPIITILLVSLGINIFFTFLGKVDWFECVGILTSVIISTFVSTLSEYKNENTFQKLQSEAEKIYCKVYRDNRLCEILIDDIVIGDKILLQTGDMIPADGRIVSGKIRVDQSNLNGESKEIEKYEEQNIKQSYEDNRNFWGKSDLFRGSVITYGQGIMVAEAVGDCTVYGKLTQGVQDSEQKSPLNIKLTKLAQDISKFGYISAFLVFIMFMFQKCFAENNFDLILINQYISDIPQLISDIVEAIIICVTVLVVAVPDGLPLMIAIVCSLNMRKMLKNNVLVRKIVGIETAGSINILFTDKTGTLTEGRLCVTKFIDGDNCVYDNITQIPEKLKKMVVLNGFLNSCASVSDNKIIGGNSTEKALLEHLKKENLNLNIKKEEDVSFSSDKKYSMAKVSGDYNGILIKGAPEIILSRCDRYLDKMGNIKYFNGKESIEERIKSYAENAERVIAFALSDSPNLDNLPQKMVFVSLVSIKDEIRKNVKNAVNEVQRAGIKVIMITGDRKDTAVAVARECGIIYGENDIILTSDELRKMSDEELIKIYPNLCVVARALPDDKNRLVRVAQSIGLVVGMTGDGVNDSPALKSADVGFSMGSGTEVAKESGDIVIIDDNFSSIKQAILYGRTIYKSIKKFVMFQLTINIAAVSVSVLGIFIGISKPLSITQMLWINLLMDTLAAIAFGGEPALKKYMLEKPKKKDEAILDKKMWSAITVNGCFICFFSIFMFLSEKIHFLFRSDSKDLCFYTGYFSYFVFSSVFNAFNTRTDGIDLIENLSRNKQFIFVMGFVAVIQILMTYFGGVFLRTVGLNFSEWITVISFALLIIPVDIIRKIIIK